MTEVTPEMIEAARDAFAPNRIEGDEESARIFERVYLAMSRAAATRAALIERGEDAFSATFGAGITPAELDNAADRIVKAIERASLTASAAHGELLQALLGKRRAA
jgi:hypothetical protein